MGGLGAVGGVGGRTQQIAHGSRIAPQDRAAAPVAFQRQAADPPARAAFSRLRDRAQSPQRAEAQDQAREEQPRGPPAKRLGEGNELARIAHVRGGIVRHEQIVRFLLRDPDADGGAAQIPLVIGAIRAAGVGEADA